MSHLVTIKTKFGDSAALAAACEALGLGAVKEDQTVKLYSATVKGTSVKLKGWKYPIVIDAAGNIQYDNFSGTWGKIKRLHELQQAYSVAVVQSTMGMGWMIDQNKQDDGTVVMTLTR